MKRRFSVGVLGCPCSAVVLVSLMVGVGCRTSIDSSSVSGAASEAAGKDDLDQVELQLGNRQTFDSLMAGYRGQVVLVDFWATWCAPCVQQFSHTVELSRQYHSRGLSVLSVSMDEPDNRQEVLAFLRQRQAHFDHLLTEYGAGSEFVQQFDLRGDIPFYKLYDRDGQLKYTFSGDPAGVENCEPIEMLDQRVVELLEAR